MVSLDSVEKNRAFAESLDAELVLLSDPERLTARAYGVVGALRLFPRRWTFYIDAEGTIVHIDTDVTPESAGPQIAETLARLAFPRRTATFQTPIGEEPGGDGQATGSATSQPSRKETPK
jgi:peroxiredoxin Q/BCP